jgi:hypothetical protein
MIPAAGSKQHQQMKSGRCGEAKWLGDTRFKSSDKHNDSMPSFGNLGLA